MKTEQAPIGSGFTAASTAAEVVAGIDLQGKIAVVTGGYSGLGLETVRVLCAAGVRVIVPARDVAKARDALAAISQAEVWPMDLLRPESIDAFAVRFLAEHERLHILINSAGIMALPKLHFDDRGHELQFATNHLGHFQLTGRLWPALARAGNARVVSVSSMGHRYSPVIFEDINFTWRAYDPVKAYGQSKTANALFAVELDRRGRTAGVRAYSVHPGGIVETGLSRHLPPGMLEAMGVINAQGAAIIDPANGLKTPAQGAATQIWCATSPLLEGQGGVYCENSDISPLLKGKSFADAETKEGLGNIGVLPHAVDPTAAAALWTLSERLTGISWPANS